MTRKGLDIDKGAGMRRGKKFFDILEEVIEKREDNSRDGCWL
jgi:hypothetical protein